MLVNIKDDSEYDVYIGRPSKWGNPFSHKKGTIAKYKVNSRKEAIEKFEDYLFNGEGKHLLTQLHELKGKRLGCWCYPKLCHGDIILKAIKLSNIKGLPF